MRQTKPIFYRALLLTGVNLLLRIAGTSFQVFLSRRIGAAGIGLLQLVLSVGSLALVAGIGGIRTATMYLTAEELGKGRARNVNSILSSCFCYSILCSGSVAVILFLWAPALAAHWIGNPQVVPALKLYAAFLPVTCLTGVMSGYFTAANRIGTLAAVEVAEQICSMVVTLISLAVWAGQDASRACVCVILGSGVSTCITLALLIILRVMEKSPGGKSIPVRHRLLQIALPLAGADVIRSGIGTTENLLVPKRLSLYRGESDPMSAFGRVSGMVFPVMMFPACILYALAELLIPELARCNASGNRERIRYLVRKGLWSAMLYGVFFGSLLFVVAKPLCQALYGSAQAGEMLRQYAIMVPFLYCDAITDAMTKGLGQQKICVRYNIITSLMDVGLLFILLPAMGMQGYFISFLVSHLINFLLSLHRLSLITHFPIPFAAPAFAASAGIIAVWVAEFSGRMILFFPIFLLLLRLFGVIKSEDLRWAKQVIHLPTTRQKKTAPG